MRSDASILTMWGIADAARRSLPMMAPAASAAAAWAEASRDCSSASSVSRAPASRTLAAMSGSAARRRRQRAAEACRAADSEESSRIRGAMPPASTIFTCMQPWQPLLQAHQTAREDRSTVSLQLAGSHLNRQY